MKFIFDHDVNVNLLQVYCHGFNGAGPLAVILSSGPSAHFSPQLMDLWLLMFGPTVWLIWDLRNKLRFEEKVSRVSSAFRTIINHVRASSPLARGHMSNKVRDLYTICSIGVHSRPCPNPKIVDKVMTLKRFCIAYNNMQKKLA
ncbi:unnamed protein product [Prunus armeniaca]